MSIQTPASTAWNFSENGAVIRFDGGVSMVLHPDQDPDKAKTQ